MAKDLASKWDFILAFLEIVSIVGLLLMFKLWQLDHYRFDQITGAGLIGFLLFFIFCSMSLLPLKKHKKLKRSIHLTTGIIALIVLSVTGYFLFFLLALLFSGCGGSC